MIDKELLDILACPFCKSDIKLTGEKLVCTNKDCGCSYRVEDDIPIMLIDEAERPCPKCSAQRDWDDDILKCPKCGTTLKYERK